MIKVAGGKFTMGRNGGDPRQSPEHEAEVADFWMDKTEVTNEEYYHLSRRRIIIRCRCTGKTESL
jgi:formylglycine-generating enzyme required for sulfatase activity